ncbi:class I SAM-dependent methyltransferase [Bacillus sonorensis]|nr:class I SAM-dependent methyltransferase [Bacillus sonorensis]
MSDYLDMLAYFGVSGAHPGGMALTKAVLAKADIDPERPILDADCGTGQTAAYLGQLLFSVTALDSDAVMLDKAKKDLQMKDYPSLLFTLKSKRPLFSLTALDMYCQNRY